MKVTRTPPGFEEEFQRLLREESGEPEYPDYMSRPLGRPPGMRMPGMGGRMPGMFPGMMPGMAAPNMGVPGLTNMGNQMGMGFRPRQPAAPSMPKAMPTAPRSPGYSDGPPHLSAMYGPERPAMNAPTSFSNAAVEAISRRNQGGLEQSEAPMQLPNGKRMGLAQGGPPFNRKRNQPNGMRNGQQNGQRQRGNGRQAGFNQMAGQGKPQGQLPRGVLIPPPIRMKSNNQQPQQPAAQSKSLNFVLYNIKLY